MSKIFKILPLLIASAVPAVSFGMAPLRQQAVRNVNKYVPSFFNRFYSSKPAATAVEAGIEADMNKVAARRSELFAQNDKNRTEAARQTRILDKANQRILANKWYDNIFPYFKDRRRATALRNMNNASKNLDVLYKQIDEHRFIDWELKKKQYYLHDLLSGMKK